MGLRSELLEAKVEVAWMNHNQKYLGKLSRKGNETHMHTHNDRRGLVPRGVSVFYFFDYSIIAREFEYVCILFVN